MPLVTTPRQLTQRAELYHQLASLTAAGIGLVSALETVRNSPPNRSMRSPLGILIEQLRQGATFTEALASVGRDWMPAFDLALVQAGESSGRLDLCFRFLSDYYAERARLARQILSDLAYPALLLHMAVLIFPTQLLTRMVWQGEVLVFVAAKAAILLPIYGAVLGLLYLAQAKHGEGWRAALETIIKRIPILGPARTNLALARLSVTLESLINAGVSIIEAWEVAAAASGSPRLKRTVLAWTPSVREGQTPADAVRESGAFPDLFSNLYATGELSGQLDETLRRLYQHYRDEAQTQMRAVAQWAPRLIYFLILLLIAYQVISFWAGYYSQIGELIL